VLNIGLDGGKLRSLQFLCIGAHSDDIEIGCGGTVLRLISEYRTIGVQWVVLGSSGKRTEEAVASANRFLSGVKSRNIVVKHFKNAFFPYQGENIKRYFEKELKRVSPDIIFTHYRHDLHQDHRLVSELTWNTFRNHLILEYEILKYDGDLGVPNVFVPLDEKVCREKIRIIMDSFESQKGKHWFTEDAFLSMLRIRGIESGSARKYAEGFYCRKMIL
jgi:LmbE family N-acetylglucosaminyl deacetylase